MSYTAYLLQCRHTPTVATNLMRGEMVECPDCRKRRRVIDTRSFDANPPKLIKVDVTKFDVKLQTLIRAANSKGIDFDVTVPEHSSQKVYLVTARHGFNQMCLKVNPDVETAYAKTIEFLFHTVHIENWRRLR
jgi:hypothetical protein